MGAFQYLIILLFLSMVSQSDQKTAVSKQATATSTTVKHRNFISEPIGDKLVTSVPGVGEKYGENLKNQGFDKAFVLLGQFLVLKKEKDVFIDFLKTEIGMNDKYALSCYESMLAYSDQYL